MRDPRENYEDHLADCYELGRQGKSFVHTRFGRFVTDQRMMLTKRGRRQVEELIGPFARAHEIGTEKRFDTGDPVAADLQRMGYSLADLDEFDGEDLVHRDEQGRRIDPDAEWQDEWEQSE